jgi:NitT/TauT family transport system permease protein
MTRVGLIRLLVVAGFVAALELLCRTGAISPRVLLAPSDMAVRLAKLLASGKANADIVETLGNVAISLVLSVTGGFTIGALIHGFPRLRAAIDPFLASYYALPFFAFYPLFIVLFGLGRGAIVAIGFLFGVVAMIIATLNGFDRIPRVLLRTAAVHHMSPTATALLIKLPSAVPYLFTGIKLAIALLLHRRHRGRIHHGLVRAGLCHLLCLQQFRQRYDVRADAVRHRAGDDRQRAVLQL